MSKPTFKIGDRVQYRVLWGNRDFTLSMTEESGIIDRIRVAAKSPTSIEYSVNNHWYGEEELTLVKDIFESIKEDYEL